MSNVWPGTPYPLGARWDGRGTNFSLFSEGAEHVELCLFDREGFERAMAGQREQARARGTFKGGAAHDAAWIANGVAPPS